MISIGLIADIQHADCDNGRSFRGQPRYYRQALQVAKEASREFHRQHVDAIINLGDTVDAKAKDVNADDISNPCLDRVIHALHSGEVVDDTDADTTATAISSNQKRPILHIHGNHELEVQSREQLRDKLGIPFSPDDNSDELVGNYSHVVEVTGGEENKLLPALRLVFLDTYDVCLQRQVGSPKHQLALEILRQHNPNIGNWQSPEGLVGVDRRFVRMGGAVGQGQLRWLRDELGQARRQNQVVIVCAHQPILPASVAASDLPATLCWNYPDILDIMSAHRDVVALVLSGHAHRDGYARCGTSGIHYRVLEAALEHEEATFGILDYDGTTTMRIRGYGACPSATYDLRHLSHSSL